MQKTSLFSSAPKTWSHIWEVTPNTGGQLIRRVTDMNQLSVDDCFRIAYDSEMDAVFKIGEHSELSSISMFTGDEAIFVFPKNSDTGVAHYVWDDLSDETSLNRAKALYKELKSLESTSDIYCFKMTGDHPSVLKAFEGQAEIWCYRRATELAQVDIEQVDHFYQAQLQDRIKDIDHDIKLCQNLIRIGGHLPVRNSCECLELATGFYCQIGNAETITLMLSALRDTRCTMEIPINFEWTCTAHDFVCHVFFNRNLDLLTQHLEALNIYKHNTLK